MAPRLIAIGDIHGCARQLDTLLEALELAPDDTVVILGDVVDRGPFSRQAIDRLIELQRHCQLIPILGNHDEMMLAAREGDPHDWLTHYGRATLASYDAPWIDEPLGGIPDEHWAFLESFQPYHESDEHLFVHANLYPELPLAEQPAFMLRWERIEPELAAPHVSGKTVICGHSSQKSGMPLYLEHTICIDTHAHGSGWLTALDVERGRYLRANDAGTLDEGWIDECSPDA